MARQPTRPAPLIGHVFRGTESIQHGLLTADSLRSSAWSRIRQDVYADARLDHDHELACRAVLTRLPATTVIAGPSAAYLHGVRHAATFTSDIHVITPVAVRMGTQRRLRVHHLDLAPDEVAADFPKTTAARTAWDVAAWLEPLTAAPVIDSMLAHGLITSATLDNLLTRHAGRRGWRRAGESFALADGGAQSPPESKLRVRLVQAGLPKPVAQCPIRVSPALILHPDLAWEQWQVAVEYDGHWHNDPDQFHRDRRRLNLLVAEGWTVLHVTSRRMQTDFDGLVREIKAALTTRGWRPRGPYIPRTPGSPGGPG